MSPKSRGRKPRQPHHRPHQQRRAHVQAARDTIPPELMSMMLSAGKDMIKGDGPLEAEVIASGLVGIWWGRDLIDADVEQVLGEAIVAEAGRRRTSESLALLQSLAAVADGRLAIKAATAAQHLEQVGVVGPQWLDAVGTAELIRAWRTWDVSGDAISLILEFAYADGASHVVSVLIDRNLGGIVKDAWATESGDEVLAGYREACAREDEMRMEAIEPGDARTLLEDAFSVTDRAIRHDPPVSDEARAHRALVLARLRLLPEGDPWADLMPEDARFAGGGWTAEAARFLATDEVKSLKQPRIVKECVEAILEYSESYDDGRLLRVSPVKIEVLLADWFPIWASLSKSQVKVLPEVLTLWCRHAAALTGAPDDLLDATLESLQRFTPTFRERAAETDAVARRLQEHVDAEDIWDRSDQVERLAFALPSEPDDVMLDADLETLEDDMFELARRVHPEYEEVLLGSDERTDDELNPRAHLALHAAVSNQLWLDDPPEVWRTARRLLLGPYDQHEIHHMLASAMAVLLHRSLVEDEPFDIDRYREELAALPGSWEAQRSTE